MNKKLLRSLAVAGAAMVGTLGSAIPAAFAQTGPSSTTYQANLTALNKSGTTGTATVTVTGNQVTVTIKTSGASANLPHAQHIHIGGKNVCPTMADDSNKDGILSTAEGQPAYGSVKVSLTTSGDVSANSAVAIDRFPKADAKGNVTYQRTFTLPNGVSPSDIANGVIVQHGVASITGDKSKYDGSQKSELDKNLPLEETAPAACGKLTSSSTGGSSSTTPNSAPGTGSGSTSGVNTIAIAVGATSLIAAGATLAIRRRTISTGR